MEADEVARRCRRLADHIEGSLPERVDLALETVGFSAVGPLLQARIAGQLRSTAHLLAAEFGIDTLAVQRSLLEHFVLGAWIAEDGDRRARAWIAEHLAKRDRIRSEQRQWLGDLIDTAYGPVPPRLTEAQEQFVAAARLPHWPSLHDQARVVDAYWSQQIADWPTSSRGKHEYVLTAHGLVNSLSRVGNEAVHPSFDTLFSFHMTKPQDETHGAIHPERNSDAVGNASLSLYVAGWAVEVAGLALGAPDVARTRRIVRRRPVR